ncbi:hypothetical protein ACFFRR_006379 [Megaselia abdita]
MDDSILAQLPVELQFEVLDRLAFQDLLSCSLVCRELAELANELIVKKGSLKIKYTFPVITNLIRSYRCFSLIDQHFLNEAEKIRNILYILTQSMKVREIKLLLLEDFESPDKFSEFFDFLTCNPEITTLSLTSFYELTLNEFIGKIRSILPQINVHILKAFENDKNAGFIVPKKLRSLEVFSEMTEIQLLTTLKSYPNLRSLRYCLKTDKNTKELSEVMKILKLERVPLEKLSLSDIECLEETTPSLSVFTNLKTLTLNFRESLTSEDNESGQKFKFVQKLYSNNFRTLKKLKFEISGTMSIYNLLPSKDVNLVLEDMVFDMSFSDNHDEDALKFVKLFINQQLSSIKILYIECLEIDDEMMNLLSECEHLEKLSLITCNISFETIWPSFLKLKHLDMTDSSITYSSLQGFLGNYRIQNTLESLSLERIHPKRGRKKQLKVTSPYNFQKLTKLNLLICNMKVDFLNKFHAPELKQLNYDYHDFELPLTSVVQFQKLNVLCLGNHSDFDGISNILTKLTDLEVFEIGVHSSLLTTVIKYLLVYGGRIKLAKIVCTCLAEVIESLEVSFKETVHNYPGFHLEFRKEREKFIKFSNLNTTIIVHTYDQAYREHSQFYENFLCTLWE